MLAKALLKNSFWVTTRYAYLSFTGFIVSLGFAHFVSKETFGQYQLVLATLGLLSFLSLPGLNIAAIKAMTKKQPQAVLEAIGYSFKWSLLAVPLLIGYGYYQLAHQQSVFGLSLIAAGVLFPLYYAPNTWYAFYEGQYQFRAVALRTIISATVVALALLTGLYFKLSVLWLVTIFLAVSSLFSFYFYLEIRRRLSGQPKRQKSLDLGFGLRVSLQKSVYTISESLPPLAVGFLLGHASVAVFQIANLFLGAVSALIAALAAITLPALFTTPNATANAAQALITGLLASLGYYLLVRLLFSYFYGPEYQTSYQIALLLTALPLVVAIRTFLVNYFTTQEKTGTIIVTYVLANLLSLGGFWLLTRSVSLVSATSGYLYLLNLTIVLPLLIRYLLLLRPAGLPFPADRGKV